MPLSVCRWARDDYKERDNQTIQVESEGLWCEWPAPTK